MFQIHKSLSNYLNKNTVCASLCNTWRHVFIALNAYILYLHVHLWQYALQLLFVLLFDLEENLDQGTFSIMVEFLDCS